jgi:transposase
MRQTNFSTWRECVAAHVRSSSNRKHTTVREHMPSSHGRYADWTPEGIRRHAAEIGRNTSALVETILRERTHPEQGFRACIGILRLAKTYGRERLEAACCRAVEIGASRPRNGRRAGQPEGRVSAAVVTGGTHGVPARWPRSQSCG